MARSLFLFAAIACFSCSPLFAEWVKCGAFRCRIEAGTVTRADIRKIAEMKMPDLNVYDLDAAMRTIEGTARTMGLRVVDEPES